MVDQLNPHLKHLKIQNGSYTFRYSEIDFDLEFSIRVGKFNRTKFFAGFVEELDYLFRSKRYDVQGSFARSSTLDRFSLISENTFQIHVKE